MITETSYKNAIEKIDIIHNQDITSVVIDGSEVKAELLYSNRMLQILEIVAPNCNYELKLAAKCQHMSRWSIPRSTFEMNKKGYYQWRAAIMEHQLKITTEVLKSADVSSQSIEIVVDALKNKADKSNINASIIEDTACLVFIKWYLVPFAEQFEPEKAKNILAKTAAKMSEHGISLIPAIDVDDQVKSVLALLDN